IVIIHRAKVFASHIEGNVYKTT
ncbi:hypothetical protein, partial [Plasmodium yoelii yoelii]